MTTGTTEQTDGGESLELPPSFTTLSTIAVQAGQSQITISVLQSGVLVHLQLVQVHPSLTEIGWDQDGNQTLVQDHQQLLQKLQKHEGEVLSVVSSQSARRRDGGMKVEEGLYDAMAVSVTEGWSLLLRLLHMRQEILTMASEFYCRASEFTTSLDEYENQLRAANGGLTEVAYDCMRRELLQKSLRVLTSSNILLEQLRQMQRTEALQRSGGVLQTSKCSSGVVLRLEELLETLQDRRRTMDQMFRLQLQQPESSMETGRKNCSLPGGQIFDQNLKLGSTSADNSDLESEVGDLDPACGPPETNLQFGFRLTLETKTGSEETRTLQHGSTLLQTTEGQGGCLKPETGPEDTSRSESTVSRSDLEMESDDPGDLWSEFQKDLKIESSSDLMSDSEDTRTQQSGSRSPEDADMDSEPRDLLSVSRPTEPGDRLTNAKPEETREASASRSGSKLEQPGWKSGDLDQEPTSGRCESTCGSEETTNMSPRPRALQLEPKFQEVPGSDVKSESGSVQTGNGDSDCRLTGSRIPLLPLLTSRVDLKSVFPPEETTGPRPGSKSDHRPGSEPHIQNASMLDSGSGPGAMSEVKSDVHLKSASDEPRPTLDQEPERNRHLDTVPTSPETPGPQSDLQLGCTRNVQPDCELDLEPDLEDEDPGLTSKDNFHSQLPIIQQSGPGSQVICTTQAEEDHPANHRRELLLSRQHLVDETWSWVQLGYSLISNSSEAGWKISEAEDALNTHEELLTHAETADQNLKQVLALTRSRTRLEPSGTIRPLTPLKVLTEHLKNRTGPAQPADPAASPSPGLARGAALVWSELQSLKMKISSNLLLLRPYARFLRMVHLVEEDMEELREAFTTEENRKNQEENQKDNQKENQEKEKENRKEKEDETGNDNSSRSKTQTKKKSTTSWEEARQKLLTAQEMGNSFIGSVVTVSAAQVHLQMCAVVQQQLERLKTIKQEVQELHRRRLQQQQQQQQIFCRRYQDRLQKTLQDLESVSQLLDSCTLMDLGSDLQTSRLLESFSQARPHFSQLDAEVENMKKNWESVRGEQEQLEVQDIKGMLQLQDSVKTKIRQVESILELASRFHQAARQLEGLLQQVPVPGPEMREQIQDLFKTTWGLKMDICRAVSFNGWTHFRLEQLEAHLGSLDSLCIFWKNEAPRRENNLLNRDVLTGRLTHDITQRCSWLELLCHCTPAVQEMTELGDSFKDLKKRFSNLKLSFLKRNEGSRNVKATRNQLQQVELYEEKLQELRKPLQAWTERLGVRPEAELHRQMGELEQSIGNHQRTLEMSCKLQQALEEFQFWCEEASATIARVDRFSSEHGSTDAVPALQQQFEMFVWPSVPEQQERRRRMRKRRVELHGGNEEQSEVVGFIKELSDRLMEVEAKLKLEHLNQQQSGDEVMEDETEQKMDADEKDEETEETKEKNLKEKRRMENKEMDGRSLEELLELKETGHTPEHGRKAAPLKMEISASRSSSEEQEQEEGEEKELQSLNMLSNLSSSLPEAQRQIHTGHAHVCPVAMLPQAPPLQATPPPADASAGGWLEVEGPSEDFLSNDGYESDVSLPPLAETPEWMVVQSDMEEGSSESAPPWGARPHPHTRCSSQVHKASEGPDLQAETTRRRSSPPSKSNRSRSAGGAIRDDTVHAGTFSSEGGAPEESRDAGTGPEVWAPTTSQMDFSSSPDHRGPLSGEGGPSSQDQDQDQDQAPSSSITCSRPQLECLTSSSSQQHLHEPGSSAGPGAPPPPQQADLHDPHPPPPPPPPHLLTPQADANVCQPVSICEEIRLTPQIRGPPLPSPPAPPAPPAPPQVEAPPQGKGPSSAPRCFSRPLSGAAVMEGSPVTLEVEVSGHPEPTLTGCGDTPSVGGALPGKRVPCVPQTSDGREGWLLLGVSRLFPEDWDAVFGTLCVLLWLLYLVVL